MERGMCVTQRPSVSNVPKGTQYHHLIFKGLGRGSGELCHRLASTQTHTEGGFGPASRNQRSLGRHPGLDPPPTRPRRTGRVPAHAARHQWADPPPPSSSPSPPPPPSSSSLSLSLSSPAKPLRRLPAHLLPGLSLTEGMGSELNLDTEFPHFTDGWERLCMEVRKQIERKESERERWSLNGGTEAGPISHRGRVR